MHKRKLILAAQDFDGIKDFLSPNEHLDFKLIVFHQTTLMFL